MKMIWIAIAVRLVLGSLTVQIRESDGLWMDADIWRQLAVFVHNREEWLVKGGVRSGTGRFAVRDLDGDGSLELMVNITEGTGHYSDNHFYRLKEDGTGIEELAQDKSGNTYPESYFDLRSGWRTTDVTVLRDNSNGRIYYLAEDYLSAISPYYTLVDGYFYLEDGCVYSVALRVYDGTYGEEGTEELYRDGNAKVLSKEEWEKAGADFINGKEALAPVKWSGMDNNEAAAASDDELLYLLAETLSSPADRNIPKEQ